jgi:hypothetical protein
MRNPALTADLIPAVAFCLSAAVPCIALHRAAQTAYSTVPRISAHAAALQRES